MLQYKEDFKKIAIAILIGIAFFILGLTIFNTTQATLIGLIAFLVTLWTNEVFPLGVTSLLPILLFPAFSVLDTNATAVN